MEILPHTALLHFGEPPSQAQLWEVGAVAPGSSWLITRLLHSPTLLAKVSPEL